jgi:hypothetical protein
MLKVVASPVNLIQQTLEDEDYIERFCAGCEAVTEEYGHQSCDADFDPTDAGCIYHSFALDRLAELRKCQREYDEIISYVPSDREG